VADLTRLVTGEGVLRLASVRDAFANRVVDWTTDPRATTTLVLTALNHALRSRQVRGVDLLRSSSVAPSSCARPAARRRESRPSRHAGRGRRSLQVR
jgi:transposase InsO family protein